MDYANTQDFDFVFIGEILSDTDPEVQRAILEGGSVYCVGCNLTQAPLFYEYMMSGRAVITAP